MNKIEQDATEVLFEKDFISSEQLEQIAAYRELNIFSLHNELRFLLYLSVLLFTGGVGLLIYLNIDSIGHIAILGLDFIAAAICYYFCFKNSSGFKKEEAPFVNPIYDYLLLTAVVLSCTFVGYLQYQYHPFGPSYGLVTLLSAAIAFFCAYYFDHKGVLSIGITGLAAYVGINVSPQTLLNGGFDDVATLSYSGILLGLSFVLWTVYASRIGLKKHFNLVYYTFALHLISISCIANLVDEQWIIFSVLLGASCFYFYKVSNQLRSMTLFVFNILYGYLGINIVLVKMILLIDPSYMGTPLILLLPIYLTFSIVLFVKMIQKFNKRTADESL